MPKSKQIAKYIRDNNIDAKSVVAMLEKYKAIAMLPQILKSLKHLESQSHPITIIESSHALDTKSLASITDKFLDQSETKKVIENTDLVGGFRVIKDYKLYDYSISGYINRLLS